MSANALIPALFGVIGLVVAYFIFQKVKEYPEGEAKVKDIGDQIHLGAMVFMRTEYKILGLVRPGAGRCCCCSRLGFSTAFSFVVGALASASAGYIGMNTATRANVRTATAAQNQRRRRGADHRLLRRLHHGPRGGLPGPARPRHPLPVLRRRPGDGARHPRLRHGRIDASRCSPASAAASSPRAPTSAPTWSARSRPASPRTTRATRASSPTTSVTTSATWPAWARTSSSPTAAP